MYRELSFSPLATAGYRLQVVLMLKFQNTGNHRCLLVYHPEREKCGTPFRKSCHRHSVLQPRLLAN